MTDLFRRFRGLGIALVVLALSATAAFAAAPHGSPANTLGPNTSESAEPSESPEASESAEPSATPDASESESPEPSDSAEPSDSPDTASSPNASQGDHGALVSTAAQMPTPSGFPNHGAFVSCVAHMDGTLATIDLTTVTPQTCGLTPTGSAAPSHGPSGHGHGHGHGRPSWAGKPGS